MKQITWQLVYEEEEYNIRVNESWKNNAKNDGKKMWSAIDWKGKSINRKTEMLTEETISSYFKQIFQSPKTDDTPILKPTDHLVKDSYVHELDKPITIEEVHDCIKNIGKGTSLDAISPEIIKILPLSMRELLRKLYDKVFSSQPYPSNWEQQLLIGHPKKGHTLSEPKLRGVGIGPVLSRGYDDIINARFCDWYTPNKEQAGFTKGQGCPLQVFSAYLLLELAKSQGQQLFIAYMDYEKAFDFLNRKLLIDKLQKKKAGSKFTSAIHRMYSKTSYTPKISDSMLGDSIVTNHGVTQGKKSSANLYSFFVSDMGECLGEYDDDFMDPANLCQLADDTAAFAATLETIASKLTALFVYSKENHQSANIGKTKYLHLSKTPLTDPINIGDGDYVESAHKSGYRYLGVLFVCSDEIAEQILRNIEDRKGNMHKFYAWLEYNEDTPIQIKLIVLYNCVLANIFYCAETWFEIDAVSDVMLLLERQGLKRCLGVKASTPDDIIYAELDRPDIVSTIKERQYNFFCKLANLDGSAIVCDILDMCAAADLEVIRYYNSLSDTHCDNDKKKRKERMLEAETTYIKRYREITNLQYCHSLYDSFLREDIRITITRWRLSCIPLLIETGRYKGVNREDRLCLFCNVIEDEEHAVYVCKAFKNLREGREELLDKNPSIGDLLCPKDKESAYEIGCFLKDIEKQRKKLVES